MMKCDLCPNKQGYRNYLKMKTMIAAGGQIARTCLFCWMVLNSGLELEDEYGFVWSRNAAGDLICRHKEATNEPRNA